MRKINLTLLFILISPLIYSKDFTFVCLNENGFNINFNVDLENKTILWTTSKVSSSSDSINANERFEMNQNQQIIFWEYPMVFAYGRSYSDKYIPTTRLFDFNTNTMYQSSNINSLEEFNRDNTQTLFQCIRS
tara:strand:- start:2461 stop:2859 length:399 start_codon:yes stop_codon:yes gene_type:complete